jgi:hypothetical protein
LRQLKAAILATALILPCSPLFFPKEQHRRKEQHFQPAKPAKLQCVVITSSAAEISFIYFIFTKMERPPPPFSALAPGITILLSARKAADAHWKKSGLYSQVLQH